MPRSNHKTHTTTFDSQPIFCPICELERDKDIVKEIVAEAEKRTLLALIQEIKDTIQIDKLSTMTMGDIGHNMAVEKILKLINSKLK